MLGREAIYVLDLPPNASWERGKSFEYPNPLLSTGWSVGFLAIKTKIRIVQVGDCAIPICGGDVTAEPGNMKSVQALVPGLFES
jgi:hypothetical protein